MRDSAFYLIPTLLARGIGLILLPVYTRYLTPPDYGIVELLSALYALLNLVLPLEISQAVARFSAESRSAAQKSSYLSTAFWFTAFAFAAWLCLTLAFPVELSSAILGGDADRFLLPLAAAAMLANALLYLAMSQLRWNMQRVAYLAVSILFVLVTGGVSVLLIVWCQLGVYGVIWGQLAGSAATLVAAAACLARTSPLAPRISGADMKALLAYSAPLVLSSIAVYLTTYTDRWLLSLWIGLDGVGLYSVALRIASILTVATSSVQLALTPLIYSHYRERETAEAIRRIFQYYLLGAFSLTVASCAFSPEIIAIVSGPEFHDAQYAVGPVMLATLVMSLGVFSPGMSLAKRTGLIAMANGAGAAVNIALSLLLIPRLGLTGAAIGSAGGAAVIMVMRFIWSQQHYFIPYRWGRCLAAFGILVLALLIVSIRPLPGIWRLTLSLLCIASFALLLLDREHVLGATESNIRARNAR